MSIYYQDDYVTLYHGDCLTEHREWLAADVLVTDPPYGMSYKSKIGATVTGDHSIEARDSMLEIWGVGVALVFGTWQVPKPDRTKATLTWDKGAAPGIGNMKLPWGASAEEIYVLGEWPPLKPGGRVRDGGTPVRSPSVIRVDTLNSNAAARPDHPTPKPIQLMERLIEKCPPGVIADPFAGSGATLVAAKNLGRKSIGVELEERYCEIIAKRLSQEVFYFGGIA